MGNVFKNPLKIKENDGLLTIVGKTLVEGYIVGLISTVGVMGALATVGLVINKFSKKEDNNAENDGEILTVQKELDELI